MISLRALLRSLSVLCRKKCILTSALIRYLTGSIGLSILRRQS